MKTILLIHGWGYQSYNRFNKDDVWQDRKKFIDKLSKEFKIIKLNLPGFGGTKEPKEKYWTLDNYANYVNDFLKDKKVDYILGYSFGGAVAVSYKLKYQTKIKLILVAPAINRKYQKTYNFSKTPKLFDNIRKHLRNMYLIYIVKNNFMKYGTKFLRETYQNIVRIDLTNKIIQIKPNEIGFIYGDQDEMVNPQKTIMELPKEYQKRIKLIKNGKHDIANSHPDKIVSLIKELFLNNNEIEYNKRGE